MVSWLRGRAEPGGLAACLARSLAVGKIPAAGVLPEDLVQLYDIK
jgi:hypothetical protein